MNTKAKTYLETKGRPLTEDDWEEGERSPGSSDKSYSEGAFDRLDQHIKKHMPKKEGK